MNLQSQNAEGGGGEKILFVDDDKILAGMMKQMFSRLGYLTEIFTDPHKAIAAFKKNPDLFDLIITDFGFNGCDINGAGLIEKIREKTRNNIPIILMTGDAEGTGINEKKLGVKILQKPAPMEYLRTTIRGALGQTEIAKAS